MLEQQEGYNNLSAELRKKLEERIEGFGKIVRYKFNLERKNPDPSKYNGEIVYPAMYTLDPVTFKIQDTAEKNGSKLKSIGLIKSTERDQNNRVIYKWIRVRIMASNKGVLRLDTAKSEDLDMIAYLELHPKMKGSLFQDPNLAPVGHRIDEMSFAQDQRKERTERRKALSVAEDMSDKDILEFVDAMSGENPDKWDSTRDIALLRNLVEEMAEQFPKMFNDKIEDEKTKIQSVVKAAIDKGIIGYDPSEGSLSWLSTGQKFVTLGASLGNGNDLSRFAEWFASGGKKETEALKKIKSLTTKGVSV